MKTLHRLFVLVPFVVACTGHAVVSSGGDGTMPPPPPPREHRPPPPPGPSAPVFDSTGWTMLGSSWVDGKHDRDTIKVEHGQGPFSQITVVVTDSDLELNDFVVVFGNRDKWSPKLRHTFREGQRSRAFDMPTGEARYIDHIEVAYSNLPGGGRARIEVYGKQRSH
jgi:hypothetical protein